MKAMGKKKWGSLLLAAAMLLAMGGGALAAPQGSLVMPPAGQNGYTSMHSYVSKTDIPGVYNVRQTISGKVEEIIPTVDVVVVVDYSGSMRNLLVNGTYAIDKARQGLLRMVDVFWDTSKPQKERDMFRIGILGFDNAVPAARETAGAATTPSNVGGMLSASNRGEMINFLNTTFSATSGGGTNMPAGFNRSFNPNVYFNAKNNPSAPVGYKTADYSFMILIGDGDTSNTVNLVQEAVRSGSLDEVFALGVSGNGFGHDPSVPNLPSAHVPPPIVPSSTQANEQALINIGTVFTDAIYSAAAPGGLNSSSYTGNFAASWPSRTMSADVSHYNYYYADQNSIAAAAFQDMADKIIAKSQPVGTGIYASTTIGDGFELYNYPGKPAFEQIGQPKASGGTWNSAGSVSSSGKTITWDIDEIPDDGSEIVLSYYIKANESNTPGLGYEVFKDSYLFYHTVQNIAGVDTPGTIVNLFPVPIITGSGDIQEGSPGGPSDPNAGGSGTGGSSGTGISSPGSGAAGHQQNRDTANDMTSGFGGGQDISPDVKDVKSGKDSTGRTKVQVDLSNGSYMRYQWQFKNAAGEWEDIFGATGSHYTLGKQFTAGKDYELRAKITNPAGKVSFTDELKVNMEVGSGGGLQTREEGPGIVSENVSDAGEEIIVANTATSPFALLLAAGAAVIALAVLMGIARKRRS